MPRHRTRPAPTRDIDDNKIAAMVLGCNRGTRTESMERGLFGAPEKSWSFVQRVRVGMRIFLYDFSSKELLGDFVATSNGMHHWNNDVEHFISHQKWSPFPCQVKVDRVAKWNPIPLSKFKDVMKYYNSSCFYFELDQTQTEKLIKLFTHP